MRKNINVLLVKLNTLANERIVHLKSSLTVHIVLSLSLLTSTSFVSLDNNSNNVANRGCTISEHRVGRGKFINLLFILQLFSFLVADYDPLNDDRGSLSRGYEPTSKSMQSTSKSSL